MRTPPTPPISSPASLKLRRASVACFGFALLAASCESSADTAQGAATAVAATGSAAPSGEVKAAAKGAKKPGVSQHGEIVSAVKWFDGDFEGALALAKSQDKQLLVDVGAYWCPPCHRLDEELFVLPEIGAFLERGFVAVHVDAEQASGPELVERYDVQAYPTMLVLEASGVERGRMVDFLDAGAFFAAMDRISRGENVLADLEARANAAPEDLELAYKAGHAWAIAAQRDKAEPHFARVLKGDAKDAKGLASKVLYDRAMFFDAKLDDAPAKAVKAYRALQAKYPGSKSARRAYRQIGRQLNKQGKADEAIKSLDTMLALAPKDTALVSSYGWFSFRQKCAPERGLEVVLAGIADTPDDADLHYLAAELSALTQAPLNGLKHIRKAAEIEPKRAYYRRQVRRFESLAAGEVAPPGGAHP